MTKPTGAIYDRSLPKVCRKCGRPLKKGEPTPFCGQQYNSDGTINQEIEYTLICTAPWHKRTFGIHDSYLIVENPFNKIIGKPHRTILERR